MICVVSHSPWFQSSDILFEEVEDRHDDQDLNQAADEMPVALRRLRSAVLAGMEIAQSALLVEVLVLQRLFGMPSQMVLATDRPQVRFCVRAAQRGGNDVITVQLTAVLPAVATAVVIPFEDPQPPILPIGGVVGRSLPLTIDTLIVIRVDLLGQRPAKSALNELIGVYDQVMVSNPIHFQQPSTSTSNYFDSLI